MVLQNIFYKTYTQKGMSNVLYVYTDNVLKINKNEETNKDIRCFISLWLVADGNSGDQE